MVIGNIEMTTQFRKTSRNSSNRNDSSIPTISILLRFGCPAAIFFAIALIVVFALNGHSSRTFPHVSEEIPKIQPLLTDCNSPTSVIVEVAGINVETADLHVCPSAISFTSGHSVPGAETMQTGLGFSPFEAEIITGELSPAFTNAKAFRGSILWVFDWQVFDDLKFAERLAYQCGSFPRTPTGLFGSRDQGSASRNDDRSAITQALVLAVFPSVIDFRWRISDHKKLAEPLPNDGFSFLWHNIADSLLCFCGGSGYRSSDSLHLQYETRHSVFKG